MQKLNKIIEYLLYTFGFLLPWQIRWIIYDPRVGGDVWEYGRISLYAFDVVFVILLAYYFVKRIRESRGQVSKILILIFLYITASILFWVDNKLISFYWLLRLMQGMGLIYILKKIDFSRVKLAGSFVMSMVLSAGLGIYQFLFQEAFASKWLGLAYHSARDLGASVVEFTDQRWLRAYGSLPHPNVLGGFVVVALIIVFYLYNFFSSEHEEIKKLEIKKLRILKLLLVANCLVLCAGLFFAFSRAAWLVFLIISLLYYLLTLLPKYRLWRPGRKLMFFCFFCFFVLCIIFLPLVKTRLGLSESTRLEVMSNVQRLTGYTESFEVIRNNLWLGAGLGNYTNELQKIYPNYSGWVYQPVHNVYLLMFSEIGVVGVILIIILLSCYLVRRSKVSKSPESKVFVFIFLCFYVFMFMFDHLWWTLSSGMLLTFLILGILDKKRV